MRGGIVIAKYTLETEFSLLNSPKAHNWILRFRNMADTAFAGKDNRSRLVGNLLIIEQYVNTLRKGLSADGRQLSTVLMNALNFLWDYVEGHTTAADFQDFANNVYASTLAHNADEALSDAEAEFYQKHFSGSKLSSIEWQNITWASHLLMEVLAIEGRQPDLEEAVSYAQISFADIDDLIAFLTDVSIHIANIPLPSSTGADYLKAEEQIYQTALFQYIIEHIQDSLKTALTAAPEQYSALRTKYQAFTIIPAEYITSLMDFQKM